MSYASIETLTQLPSVVLGAAATLVCYFLLETIYAPRREWSNNSHENQRRETLRSVSTLYKYLEPLVDDLVRWRRRIAGGDAQHPLTGGSVARIERNLRLAREYPPWTGEEFLAMMLLEGCVAAGLVGGVLFWDSDPLNAVLMAAMSGWFWNYLRHRDLTKKGESYVISVKRLMPYSIDLMALMMRAGAGFPEAVNTVVAENPTHPVGNELGEVMREVSIGHPRSQALERFKDRIADTDIGELVFAINKGEELGTPLTTILRNQADQMRLKRTQMVEKLAAAGQVKMMGPVMLIMLACLLLMSGSIIGPTMTGN